MMYLFSHKMIIKILYINYITCTKYTMSSATQAFNQEEFINQCAKGNLELAEKKLKKDGVDVNCKEKQSLNTAAHVAALNDQLQVLRMLAKYGFKFNAGDDLKNNEGNTPLHLACEKPNLEIILFLLMQGTDYTTKNTKGYKPGQNTLDARIFLSSTLIPEEKAFTELDEQEKAKLEDIFNDIDFDDQKAIDLHKAVRFNKYIQESIAEPKAEKDANDFLKAAAICNKHSVNIDEWLFCFAKLHFSDKEQYQKFIDDYEAAVAAQGKLKSINI